jgi:hypothetical protein
MAKTSAAANHSHTPMARGAGAGLCVPALPKNACSALDGCHRTVIKTDSSPSPWSWPESLVVAEIGQLVKSAVVIRLHPWRGTIADSFNLPRLRTAQTLSSARTCELLARDHAASAPPRIGCTADTQPL